MDKESKIAAEKNNIQKLKKNVSTILMPLSAVTFGLFIGAVFMLAIDKDPVKAYQVLWTSSFGSLRGFYEALVNTTPLIFTGLAVAFAFKTGLFNIGGDGQFLIAYVATAWVGYVINLPWYLHILFALLAGITTAGIWGGVAGYLKAHFGVHEVITTIMFNYIALYLTGYLIGGPLMKPGELPATPEILESARLWRFPGSRLNLSFIIALLAALFIYYLLWKTVIGYEVRAVGLNPEGAEYGGIHVGKKLTLVMFISGSLAGLAGSVQVMGLEYRAYQPFGFLGFGFTGIAVALLGKNHPAGVILAAFLFGSLNRGAMMMQSLAGVPKEVIEIIQAIIIFFAAAEYIFILISRKLKERKEAVSNA